ncbi:MAG: HNH endonuclease [Candidatus Berkelbacteria bacterium]|nr:HNH endonuclease [Candidatus Berkelbacteria bacterium]
MPIGIYKRTENHRRKLSLALMGRKVPDEVREKMSKSHKGMKKPWVSLYWKGKVRLPFSEEWRVKNSERHKAGKNQNWKGGISTYERKLYLNARRRVWKLGNGGFHTQGEWETLKARYNWTCPSCKRKEPEVTLTEDHIIPLSKEGTDYIENIQPLCKSCNSVKHSKVIKFEINV